jgi:hypothetical protein
VALFLSLSMLLFESLAANASQCGALESERANLSATMLRLVANYPGTHAMLAGCAAAAQNEQGRSGNSNDAANTFLGCVVVGCLVVGVDNCGDIAKEWFSLYGQDKQVESRMQALGCRE